MLKVIRNTLTAVACLVCATAFASSPTSPQPVARDLTVVVLPGGFRVEGVYLSEARQVLDLVQAIKPKAVVIKVCRLTPEKDVAGFQSSLNDIYQGGQTVLAMPRNALECSFPTDRERGGRGA